MTRRRSWAPESQRRRLRAAVVGAGLMGRWHADAVRRAGATVAAVIDPAADRAASLASIHGATVSDSLTPVLGTVDVVHLCTPTPSHEDLAAQAIDAGRHTLVEKPLASTAAATRALLARAAARQVLLCPVHQFPWQPGAQRLAETLPALGAVRHVDVTICSAGAALPGAADADTIAIEILPHPLSLLSRLFPPALEASWMVQRPACGELRLTSEAAGATVSILISMSGRPPVNALRIVAERGTAYLNLFHGFVVIERGGTSRRAKIAQPLALSARTMGAATANLLRRVTRREPAYPGLRAFVAEFYRAASEGGPPPVPEGEAVAIAEIMDLVRRLVLGA